jgi:hypothetical protein
LGAPRASACEICDENWEAPSREKTESSASFSSDNGDDSQAQEKGSEKGSEEKKHRKEKLRTLQVREEQERRALPLLQARSLEEEKDPGLQSPG